MKREAMKKWKPLGVLMLLMIVGVLIYGDTSEIYGAVAQSDNLVTELSVADEKLPRTGADDAIVFNPKYELNEQKYTVGEEIDLHFLLYCYGNEYQDYYVEIYNEVDDRVAYEYDYFPTTVGVYSLDLTWSAQMSPGKYTIKCYSLFTEVEETITVYLEAKEGEYFANTEKGVQTALNDNLKKPLDAWKTTNVTRELWQEPINYQIQMVEMYIGDTAAYIVEEESSYNDNPADEERWILMKFYLKNTGKNEFTASEVISRDGFYSKKGQGIEILATAMFNGKSERMEVADLKLSGGADGYFWIGILVPESVGYPYMRLQSGYDSKTYKNLYTWLSINPTEDKVVYKNIADTTIKLSDTAYTYNGKAKKPTVTIKDGSTKLKKGTHYTVSYKNNKKVGDATVTIKGKGKYAGTVTQTFTIGAKKGTSFTVGNYKYKVTGAGEVAFVGLKKNIAKVKVADTVKYNKATYKITSIADKALKGKTKVTSVTVGENVKKIGKEAFSGCKKLKTITVKATNLKSVGKNALKGINAKATIKVPKEKLTSYKKVFKSKGQGKKVKIKKG